MPFQVPVYKLLLRAQLPQNPKLTINIAVPWGSTFTAKAIKLQEKIEM